MKLSKIFFGLIGFTFIFTLQQKQVFSQEIYEIMYVDQAKVPVLGDGVDLIWNNVVMAPVAKSIDYGDRSTDMYPSPEDYKIDFGALWNEYGLYFLVKVVDDVLVRDNGEGPDNWWYDDAIMFLFTKDIQELTGEKPIEFAWNLGNDVENKATVEQGIPVETVNTGWTVVDNYYYDAEVFIAWEAFNAAPKAGDMFPLEVRGRDDDEFAGITPQTYVHWSSETQNVSSTGEGMGIAILSDVQVAVDEKRSNKHPLNFSLHQNYPNPFNPITYITYCLKENVSMQLTIYDINGKEITVIEKCQKSAGIYTVQWNGKDKNGRSVASGTYFYNLKTKNKRGSYQCTNKMLFLR